MKTLFELDSLKTNNFDVIRFVAATLVIFSHAYAASGHPGEEPLSGATGFIGFGNVAVEIFFFVSGYLITASLMHRDNLLDFTESRVLRIFPALFICCAASAFLLGPLVSTLPLGEYLTHRQTWVYFLQNSSLVNMQWFLPGVFEANALKGVVNGSLWTLPTEIMMYGVLLGLGIFSRPFNRYRSFASYRPALLTTLIAAYLIYSFIKQTAQIADHTSADPTHLITFFLIGAIFYLNRRYVPMSTTLALVLWVALILARGTPASTTLYYVAMSYSILAIAFDTSFKWPRFAKYGDFSYGLYLYGFPVKQAIMLVAGSMGSYALFLIAFPITLLLAWLSWRFVESPALARKGTISRYLKSLASRASQGFGERQTSHQSAQHGAHQNTR